MQPLISVIVPVYNTEKYLRKCVDSILDQTYSNIEVILVDDGSPDGCPAICDEYASKDTRVKVIHQANAGVSAARNAGLDAVKGEYIGFVDSDDVCAPFVLETLSDSINSNTILSLCSYKKIFSQDVIWNSETEKVLYIEADKHLNDIIYGSEYIGVCATLFVKLLVDGVRFHPQIRHNEDKLFLFEYLLQKKGTVAIQPCAMYGYYSRVGSATRSGFTPAFLDAIDANQLILQYTKRDAPTHIRTAELAVQSARLSTLRIMIREKSISQYKQIAESIRADLLRSWISDGSLRNLVLHLSLIPGTSIFTTVVRFYDWLPFCLKNPQKRMKC